MIDEKKYNKLIKESNLGPLRKFSLNIQVAVAAFYLKLKFENVEPDETWLISQLKSEGINV